MRSHQSSSPIYLKLFSFTYFLFLRNYLEAPALLKSDNYNSPLLLYLSLNGGQKEACGCGREKPHTRDTFQLGL